MISEPREDQLALAPRDLGLARAGGAEPTSVCAMLALALLLSGCVVYEPGLTLQLELTSSSPRFQTPSGTSIEIERGFVMLRPPVLEPCEVPLSSRVLRALSPLGLAYAHNVEGPNDGRSSVLELGGAEHTSLHQLRPSPGRYCRVRLMSGPDAATELPPEMIGKTFFIEGRFTDAGGEGRISAFSEAWSVQVIELEEPLVFDADHRTLNLRLELDLDVWFLGWAPDRSDAQTLAAALSSAWRVR